MVGDEFKVWHRAPAPFYCRIRTYVYVAGLLASFYAGSYYNAWRQVDSVLPMDTSEVRDLGYVAPAQYRLEVGML
jgi:heme A synthase